MEGGSVSLMAGYSGYFFGHDSENWRLSVSLASIHGMHEPPLAYTVIGFNTLARTGSQIVKFTGSPPERPMSIR